MSQRLLTSVVAAIVPSCLCALIVGLHPYIPTSLHPYIHLISFEIFLLALSVIIHAEIIEGPGSFNATLNGEAHFVCTAVGEFFIWKSNDKQIDYGIELEEINDEIDDHRRSTLKKNVTLADNNTFITCIVVSLNPDKHVTSDSALLLVQGMCEIDKHE